MTVAVYMCDSLNYLVESCKNENSSTGILVSLCDDGQRGGNFVNRRQGVLSEYTLFIFCIQRELQSSKMINIIF